MKSPYVYAAAASGYIVLVVSLLSALRYLDGPDTFLAPVVMLSLLTLSVAIMGFLFFYEPLGLFFEGRRAEALGFFARTLGTFAAFTVALLGAASLL